MNYTSKEQSKRLIELGLSKDTADMFYPDTNELSEIRALPRCIEFVDDKAELPCWSVGALLEILLKEFPDGGIIPDNSGYWAYGDESGFGETRTCTTIIDALYEFICWALEKSYIK